MCPALCDPMGCSLPGLPVPISRSLPKCMSTESVMPSNHHPLPPSSPFAFNLSHIRVFSNELALRIRWPKYWSFSFNISPSNEYSALISFRMDWLELLAVQGTLKSLFQHHSSKAPILQHSGFFMVQFSHPHTTTGKTMALTIQTFVSKLRSLLFNTLSRFFITFLPRRQASFNFKATVTVCSDLGAQENKVCPCLHLSFYLT